ncbi:hypothetical protein PoB_004967000 [Plakobranchus ocellatus]|uniref:Uncharacterized protein n=1 Tax=Plakobranchus ocellatus TaxID=259542 RepID=A0AAV4BV23_9GAST|nr:hypothetical protein PoB_004967000 [Plakobranchus ocellatus]
MVQFGATRRVSLLLTVLALFLKSTAPQSPGSTANNNNNNSSSIGSGSNSSLQVTTPRDRKSQCWLSAHKGFRDELSVLLNVRKAKLVEVTVHLPGHPAEQLIEALPHVYRPHLWIRSTSRQGRSLLMLDETYDPMSLTTLTIGVEEITANLTDHPVRCLREMTEEETLKVIRASFLRDFSDPNKNPTGSLSQDEHICSKHIVNDGGYAHFVYRCCRFDQDGQIECQEVTEDNWIRLLLTLIIIIKVLIVLFSPMFIPERMYRLKYVAAQYFYHVPGPPLTLKVVVSQDPDQFGPDSKHKRVRLEDLKNMEIFKTMVASSRWLPEKIYEVKVKDVRLSVKARRLLDKCTVPVSIKSILYNNLIRCRIRKLDPLKECCNSNILGRFNPGINMIKWHQCMRCFAGICLMALIALPWILRMYGYFTFEADMRERQENAASSLGLEVKYPGSIVLYLTPIHGLFIFIYIIFIIDSLVYGVISKAMKEKFKHVIRDCLRDMRERSRIAVVAWMTKLLVLPFTLFGVLGFLLFLPYLVILAVVGLPVAAFYIFPTLNLSVRLLINLFIFMCPDRVMNRVRNWHGKFSSIRERFSMQEVTANETFVKRHEYTKGGIALQLAVIIMVLISFWSLTLLLMEIVSFFVELLVYTFMGVIVNAGTILQYVTVLFLLFLYSKNTFSRVTRLYQAYHAVIHGELLSMKKQEIDEVAKMEATDQENTAFIVQGDQASNKPKGVIPQIKVKVSGSLEREVVTIKPTVVTSQIKVKVSGSLEQEVVTIKPTAVTPQIKVKIRVKVSGSLEREVVTIKPTVVTPQIRVKVSGSLEREVVTIKPTVVTSQIRVKEHQPQWTTRGLLVFLDRYDTPYTPEKFFFETIDLNYFGCPGPIYTNVLAAIWEFLKIVLFLLFIFIVVMAFGDAYQVSTTNQLLATVVGGFVPFLFRYIFVSDAGVGGVDTQSIQFITEFHRAINNYVQSWAVFDIVPASYKEWDGKDDEDDDDDAFHDMSHLDGNGNKSNSHDDPNTSTVPLLDSTRRSERDAEVARSETGDEARSPMSARSSGRGGGSSYHASTPPLIGDRSSLAISIDDNYPAVDIIVDVSTSKTRRVNALVAKGFEKGSMSMLDRSASTRGSARENAPIYNPNDRIIHA